VSAEEDVTVSATDKAPSVTGLIMTVALYTGRIQLYPHSLTSTHLHHQYTSSTGHMMTSLDVLTELWPVTDRQTDRQRDRQTDRHTAISYTELA